MWSKWKIWCQSMIYNEYDMYDKLKIWNIKCKLIINWLRLKISVNEAAHDFNIALISQDKEQSLIQATLLLIERLLGRLSPLVWSWR